MSKSKQIQLAYLKKNFLDCFRRSLEQGYKVDAFLTKFKFELSLQKIYKSKITILPLSIHRVRVRQKKPNSVSLSSSLGLEQVILS